MKVWLNGAMVERDAARVSVFDHGFTVGDGVFETTKVVEGRPFALTRHLARLTTSASTMGLQAPDLDLVRAAVEQVVEQLGDTLGRVRITYTAGEAPLGSGRGDAEPTLVVAASPMTPWAATESVVVVPWVRNERSAVAGVKTTAYAENVVALAHAKAAGAGEALFANTAGELCEGTGTNVFVVRDGIVRTPALEAGCLAGITRALVLAWCPQVREERLTPADLAGADEVFLTSATRDVQGVHAVDGRSLGNGPVTVSIADTFVRNARLDPDPI
ncbi:aminotransferase class IV [Sporichthya sp.]|uniref:aminotransferase class IV n=1 Tax=Sporichthya sp. TaxID=65475 RepID=UPI0017AE7502|nr:aminotransferase class IV [Sporichthya sp.]MBA3741901.1 aminotransferase class IV [Sporichthya sp.]